MNEKLQKVLRVLKARGLIDATSDKELAWLSELSRQTINRSKPVICEYLKSAPSPSKGDETFVDKKSVMLYVDIALNSGTEHRHFAQVTGAVAGFVLRRHTNLINNIQTPKKIVRVGQAYLNLVAQIESRKNDKGTPIHSQNREAKYLLTELNNSGLVKQLFSRSNSYRADQYSKLWKLTDLAHSINNAIREETIKLIDQYNVEQQTVTHLPLHIGGGVCSGENVNRQPLDQLVSLEDRTIDLPIVALKDLCLRSFLQVMDVASPSPPHSISVPLKNLANVNPDLGRTYNIFTRLKGEERKALGYHSYDISGGLQMICFNILFHFPHSKYKEFEDLQAAYSVIFRYGYEPDVKIALRQEIANDLGISIDEVKELLTAYANGSQKKVGNSPVLREFYEQSDQLRREVIAVIGEQKPELLESAIEQSKKSFPEDMDWQSIEKESDSQSARDKASVFFFVWTYFEKQVRDAMLSVVDDGIPVHDAIYSKHKLPPKVFEKAVYEKTGFEVKIGQ